MTLTPGFTGSTLDRCEPARAQAEMLDAMAMESGALLLDLDGYDPRVEGDRLGWSALPALAPEERVLLGRIDGKARFARLDPDAPAARRTNELMSLLAGLHPAEAELYATARSLLDWHARHRFCANCGSPTAPFRAGWARLCPSCATEHFPRTDPVVIMLAEHEDQVLIGRQPAFPPGRYSALAGFVEVGESIEEAVRRELFEEAGICAGNVRYLASQPWPFPSQLMIGCIAETDDPTITLDRLELEDAKWVSRAEVRAAFNREEGAAFLIPPPIAIAHTLFQLWLAEG